MNNQSINQYIYKAPWYRDAYYSADYAETKRTPSSEIREFTTSHWMKQSTWLLCGAWCLHMAPRTP